MGGSNGAPRRTTGHESLTVAVVARMVGVAPSTLRTWARRYGLEPSGHRSGLHRRYSETDVARLRHMRALAQAGLSSRDAARRAMEATEEELTALPAATGGLEPDHFVVRPLSGDGAVTIRTFGLGTGVSPAVQTLLGTLGNADAQGSTALLRAALRDLGAARTWDDRVLPARIALWRLAPGSQRRASTVLTEATVSAVGEVRLRRARRNRVPVHVVSLPGHDDPAAVRLLEAALAERSIGVDDLALAPGASPVPRMVVGSVPGCLVVRVPDDPLAAQLAGRLRHEEGQAGQVHWGDGWVRWPGQAGGMTDVVRAVEQLVCPPLP